jgi:hypothetical protein
VAYPRFSYFAEDGVATKADAHADADFDRHPSADAAAVAFGEPRSLGARFMLTVTQNRRTAQLDLEWSDESGWGATAESMLLQIESLVVRGAATR